MVVEFNPNWKAFFANRLLVAATLIAFCHCCYADESGLPELIQIYRNARTAKQAYKWDFKYSKLEIARPDLTGEGSLSEKLNAYRSQTDILSLPAVDGYRASGSIVTDFSRYNLKLDYSAPWVNGASDRISVKSQRCFDGKLFGSVSRSLPGQQFPKDTSSPDERSPTVADIGSFTREKREIDLQLANSGLWGMMPLFPTPNLTDTHFMEFGSFLEAFSTANKDEFACWKEDSGTFRLNAWVFRKETKSQSRFCYWFHADGSVDRIESQMKDGTVKETYLFDYSKGNLMSVTAMDWLNGRGFRLEYSSFSPVQEISDKTFRITIPSGAIVNDLDKGIQYTAGVTTEAEALELAKFVKDNDLASSRKQRPFFALTISFIFALVIGIWFFRKR